MTERELKYLEILNSICNQNFTEEDHPAAFDIAIEDLIKGEGNKGYKSKKTQDLGVSYSEKEVIQLTYDYIWPHMRQRW